MKIDKHLFFTRLAIDYSMHYNEGRRLNVDYQTLYNKGEHWVKPMLKTPRLRAFKTIEDRLSYDINFWIKQVSQSYENQTYKNDFEVHMLYDEKYESLVRSFKYPSYVNLLGPFNYSRYINLSTSPLFKSILSDYDNQSIAIHKIDSDDWYRNDFFEYFTKVNFKLTSPHYCLITHNSYRKFNLKTKEITKPIIDFPGFTCSTIYDKFDKNKIESLSYLPHSDMWMAHFNLHTHQRIMNENPMLLQTIGVNLSNDWGDLNRFPIDKDINNFDLQQFNLL